MTMMLGRLKPGVQDGDAGNALVGIVDRIEATLDAETAAFTSHQPIDLATINQRKRQGLLELSRLVTALNPETLDERARRSLNRLSGKLETNRAALSVQLRAVAAVADIITATIREAESDGTYSLLKAYS